jgi:hypothetical protein
VGNPRFIRSNDVSLEAMHNELLGLDVSRSVPAVDVPVIFFLGRYDRHVDATIAARYFDKLVAEQALVWFENSAPIYRSKSPTCSPRTSRPRCDRSTSAGDRIDPGQPSAPARGPFFLKVHRRCATAGVGLSLQGTM